MPLLLQSAKMIDLENVVEQIGGYVEQGICEPLCLSRGALLQGAIKHLHTVIFLFLRRPPCANV